MLDFRSRSDVSTLPWPVVAPTIGKAGSSIIDPNFGSTIIRATDENSTTFGKFCSAGVGGSADLNVWNLDSTMLAVEDSGGGSFIVGFDPVALTVKRLFGGFRFIGSCVFSTVNPDLVFNFNGTKVWLFDLSDRSAPLPPPPALICDFASQLPSQSKWNTVGGVQNNDTVFAAAFSVAGSQGTGVYACVFSPIFGYRTWQTDVGHLFIAPLFAGSVSNADRFTIHNVKLNKTGQWLVVTPTKYLSSPANHGPYFWNILTNQVNNIGPVAWGGHWTAGYCEFYNWDSAPNIPFGARARRSLYNLNNPTPIASLQPASSLLVGLDDHPSINGPDSQLMLSTTARVIAVGSAAQPFKCAWYNEVLGFDLTGKGTVWRFCSTFARGNSGNFYADNAIGSGDQQNKFVAFSSDWGGQLSRPCDVFIVKLA